MKTIVPICLVLSSSTALADWDVQQEPQFFSMSPGAIATVATVEAKSFAL